MISERMSHTMGGNHWCMYSTISEAFSFGFQMYGSISGFPTVELWITGDMMSFSSYSFLFHKVLMTWAFLLHEQQMLV